MKTLTFKKNSLHYALARMAGFSRFDDPNICSYTRHVIGGLLQTILIAGLIALAGFVVSHMLLGVYFSIMMGTIFLSEIALVGWGVTILVLSSAGFFAFLRYRQEKRWEKLDKGISVPDSFVKEAYNSWKGKFCIEIKFTE